MRQRTVTRRESITKNIFKHNVYFFFGTFFFVSTLGQAFRMQDEFVEKMGTKAWHSYDQVFQTTRPFIREVISLYGTTNPKSNVASTQFFAYCLKHFSSPAPTICMEDQLFGTTSFDNGLVNDDYDLSRLTVLAPYFKSDATVMVILPFWSTSEGDTADSLGFTYLAKGPYLFPEDGTKWFGAMFMKR